MKSPLPKLPIDLSRDYALSELLGRGGMSTVWKALRRRDGKPVAVKILSVTLRDDPELLARLETEARLSTASLHPALVEVLECRARSDPPYIVMELIEGPSLRRLIRESRPMAVETVLEIGRALAEGLGALHGAGIVHRDLKPENVILQAGNVPRLLDLGLARVHGGQGTRTGIILGTPDYLAPEVCRGEAVRPQSDVFALGLLMLECLADSSPFPSSSEQGAELLARRARGEERFPLPGSLPSSVRRLLLALLADDPRRRPTNGEEAVRRIAAAQAAGDEASLPEGDGIPRPTMALEDVPEVEGNRTRFVPRSAAMPELAAPAPTPSLLRRWAIGATSLALLLLMLGVLWTAGPGQMKTGTSSGPSAATPSSLSAEAAFEEWQVRLERLWKEPERGLMDPQLLKPAPQIPSSRTRMALQAMGQRLLEERASIAGTEEPLFDAKAQFWLDLISLQFRLPGCSDRGEGDYDRAVLVFGDHGRYLLDSFHEWEMHRAKRQVETKEEEHDFRALLKSYNARAIVRALEGQKYRRLLRSLLRLWQDRGGDVTVEGSRLFHPGLELIVAHGLTCMGLERELRLSNERLLRVEAELLARPLARPGDTRLALQLIYGELVTCMRRRETVAFAAWRGLWEKCKTVDEAPAPGAATLPEGRIVYVNALVHGWNHLLEHGTGEERERAARELRALVRRYDEGAYVPWIHRPVADFLRDRQRGDLAGEILRDHAAAIRNHLARQERVRRQALPSKVAPAVADPVQLARWQRALAAFCRSPALRASAVALRRPGPGVPTAEAMEGILEVLRAEGPVPTSTPNWNEKEADRRFTLVSGMFDLLLRFPGLTDETAAPGRARLMQIGLELTRWIEALRLWDGHMAALRIEERSRSTALPGIFKSLPIDNLDRALAMGRSRKLAADLERIGKREGADPEQPESPLLGPPLELMLGTALIHSRELGAAPRGLRRLKRTVERLRKTPWGDKATDQMLMGQCLRRIVVAIRRDPTATEGDFEQIVARCEELDGPPLPGEAPPGIRKTVTAAARVFHACHLLDETDPALRRRGYDMALGLCRLYSHPSLGALVHGNLLHHLDRAGYRRQAAVLRKRYREILGGAPGAQPTTEP